ncbi:MAG: universal stress protein [Gammaproteobacteria bacterium]|nr:universal stress protein [Gammaproteobacteria bacterium]
MAIKDILVYVDNDELCDERLDSATSLCKVYDAYLSGVYVKQRITIPAYAGVYMPVEVYETNDKETTKLLDEAKARFKARINTAGINGDLHDFDGDVSYQLSLNSRYADLLIVPQRLSDNFDLNPYFQVPDILLGAACPVLLLPDSNPDTLPPERVMLAWDGGRECAKALKAALPMLSEVKKIDVVAISTEPGDATAIAQHIDRHGFETEVRVLEGSHSEEGKILLEQAQALDSQMIVMGAYGHSRIRELMLGGTTRYVLEHTSLPVLFSH